MQVVFRVDASLTIGSGHVMRCLTLADALHKQGVGSVFICRELPGHMCDFIEGKGYQVYRLSYCAQEINNSKNEQTLWLGETWQTDAEQTGQVLQKINATTKIHWLIVDHYSLDLQWEEKMKPYTKKIMVIDDLANRHHDCDLLLDQNLYMDMQTRYSGLLPTDCQSLLGPQYALLRQEFHEARKKVKVRKGVIKRILVFFGGSDFTNETFKALKAIRLLNRVDIGVDVIVGNINPHKEKIKNLCSEMPNTTFHCQINNMAELMVKADLAIGAGGTATWERSFLGLPAITLIVAENQRKTTEAVAKVGAIINLGWHTEVNAVDISDKLLYILQSNEILQDMSRQAIALNSIDSTRTVVKYISRINA